MTTTRLSRLPAIHVIPVKGTQAYAFHDRRLEPWALKDHAVAVDAVGIQAVWPTHNQTGNGDLIQLFRQCTDPIAGYYNYLAKTRRHVGGGTGRDPEVLVLTDQGNAYLELPVHSTAKAILRPLRGPWIHTPSRTLTSWVYRRLAQLVDVDTLQILLQLTANHLWDSRSDLRAAFNSPTTIEGKVLREVFGGTSYDDIELHFRGLFDQIQRELPPQEG